MNGDGILDIISITAQFSPDPNNPSGDSVVTTDRLISVLLAKPDGTFQPQDTVISLGPGGISDVAVGEVSGDQRPDIIVASPDGPTRIWENTCQ
jgi:hypothetical protein